jgi:hypothetical protein
MQQVETKVVMLEATRDVELRPGLVLPPGPYSGTETNTHLVGTDQNRTPCRFEIKLAADQLAAMGAEVRPNLISETIDDRVVTSSRPMAVLPENALRSVILR